MKTSRHLSAVYYHRHWRNPALSHAIYSQALYILSNLLSSPSRWWKEPPLTSLRDSIIQEHKRWFAKIPIMQREHLHAICTLMSLNTPALFLKLTFNDEPLANGSEILSQAIVYNFNALITCLITSQHPKKHKKRTNILCKRWGLSGTVILGTASFGTEWGAWVDVRWSHPRLFLNYVIKGA